ncbi:MAG: arylamine N-acetyltransferase [Saprospiraceae bacterium]|jgi:N-hydroxyarylamine O-acetyltransferase|nr:arylamine N-acetyltransferase [Saprospiraceae bacterium]
MIQQKYLQRINYSGKLEPSLKDLQDLHKAHLFNVPFENLDIHYDNKIELRLDQIFQKIMHNNRGGFCYELNGLFAELLDSIGFKTKRISARVFNKEKGYKQEFGHLATLVIINEEEYLTDVGFGDFTVHPLKLELGKLQNDPTGLYLIDKFEEDYFRVNRIQNGEKIPQYIFKNMARDFLDFTEMCHYHQTDPSSPFTQKKLITVPTESGRITITENSMKIKVGNTMEEVDLKTKEEFQLEIWKKFKVDLEKI